MRVPQPIVFVGGALFAMAVQFVFCRRPPEPECEHEPPAPAEVADDEVEPEPSFDRTRSASDVLPTQDVPRMPPLEAPRSRQGNIIGLREGAVVFVDPTPTIGEREMLENHSSVFRAAVPTYLDEHWVSAYVVHESFGEGAAHRVYALFCATFDRRTGRRVTTQDIAELRDKPATDNFRMSADGAIECTALPGMPEWNGVIGERRIR
jgi:hypothetical protein